MDVSELAYRGHVRRSIRVCRTSRENVDDRLRGHSRNGGASNVLDADRKILTRQLDPRRLHAELSRPEVIIRSQPNWRGWHRAATSVELDARCRLVQPNPSDL